MKRTVPIIDGPLNGHRIDRPSTNTVIIPMISDGVFGQVTYTMRRARDMRGNLLEVLVLAGEPIDPDFMATANLLLEH